LPTKIGNLGDYHYQILFGRNNAYCACSRHSILTIRFNIEHQASLFQLGQQRVEFSLWSLLTVPSQFLKVLLIEDHALQRVAARKLLSELGVGHIYDASDGLEAIEIMRQESFDLVLCDIDMPRCSGPELMSEIVRRGTTAFAGTLPVWVWMSVLSQEILESHRVLACEHFFPSAYALSKPLKASTLAPLLREATARKCQVTVTPRELPTGDELRAFAAWPHSLVVMLQPQFHLLSGVLSGGEALCRWQHPRLGLLGPEQFIPQLEAMRIADAIFLEATVRCLEAQKTLSTLDIAIDVGINASAQTLCKPGVIEHFDNMVGSSDVPRSRITIELTEDVSIQDSVALSIALNRLRLLGYGVAIDDFGIGIATLKLLADLPFTQIKIDRSFVGHILGSDQRSKICRSMIRLAIDLGLGCVAEGVETEEQRTALQELACSNGQGYLWAPAEPIDVFLAAATRRMTRP
jgi:EAL domain-containing protein (putative c-di-GMP-specific phosphodiesterase class I)